MKKLSSLLVASVLGGALSLWAFTAFFNEPTVVFTNQANQSYAQRTSNSPIAPNMDFTFAAEMSVNAVVHVKTIYPAQNNNYSMLEDLFWGRGRAYSQPSISSGSGVIISNDGYIVTNNHVVENAEKVEVTLNDNRSYTATIIGTDPMTDIALIKIDEQDLPIISFDNSDKIKVGEWVLAVGNPFNLNSTVTAGIVSAKSRDIDIIEDNMGIESFIQTDAVVNPGNSGGALVNVDGQLVGINTAISTHTGSFEGYSFAVPSNMVKKVVDDLLEFGTVQRALLGVTIGDLNAEIAGQLKIDNVKGIYIGGVNENGGAKDAGIKEGDIIVGVDGSPVSKSSELQEHIGTKRPGDIVKVEVSRNGALKTFDVTLKNLSGNTNVVTKAENDIYSVLGADFIEIDNEEKTKLGIKNGVKVEKVYNGKFRRVGIAEGFIVTKINHKTVNKKEDIINYMNEIESGAAVLVEGYHPNGKAGYYAFGK